MSLHVILIKIVILRTLTLSTFASLSVNSAKGKRTKNLMGLTLLVGRPRNKSDRKKGAVPFNPRFFGPCGAFRMTRVAGHQNDRRIVILSEAKNLFL